ncbi:MAG: hypothetical protein PWQ28_415 [Candidatus Woesearchaeota archaeon]|nr:hypothetical protein [Candidatus Woesearchaeota archaeon]
MVIMNKKGVFFTIMSITLISVVLLILAPYPQQSLMMIERADKTALEYGNDFFVYLENSILPSMVKASSYSALNNISREYDSLLSSGKDFETAFKMLLWNETSTIAGLGNPYNMTYLLTELEKEFDESSPDTFSLSLSKNYTESNISIFQNDITGPYQVGVNVSVKASLKTNVANWSSTIHITSYVPIIGLEDPVYAHYTEGKYHNYFNLSTLDLGRNLSATPDQLLALYTPVQIGCFLNKAWNSSCFEDHVNRSAYFKNSRAPSFIQRMNLDITYNSSCCGIESFLNPAKIDMSSIHYGPDYNDPDGDDKNMTYVDYCFFSGQCGGIEGDNPDRMKLITDLYCLNDTFPYIKIDYMRLDYYNLSECANIK